MCGIVRFVGSKSAAPIIVEGLRSFESAARLGRHRHP